ncbi:hypothetical protein EYF80_042862 [Liparis tanakae]|uniref:Uncharacterized protein n=1 Tax=Liparis tanakae TaxID=230148 RepID=A0A4Z2G049_9TELE|nr:hypothetical protein EYF80_042862 [Liparis tanakae]
MFTTPRPSHEAAGVTGAKQLPPRTGPFILAPSLSQISILLSILGKTNGKFSSDVSRVPSGQIFYGILEREAFKGGGSQRHCPPDENRHKRSFHPATQRKKMKSTRITAQFIPNPWASSNPFGVTENFCGSRLP